MKNPLHTFLNLHVLKCKETQCCLYSYYILLLIESIALYLINLVQPRALSLSEQSCVAWAKRAVELEVHNISAEMQSLNSFYFDIIITPLIAFWPSGGQ